MARRPRRTAARRRQPWWVGLDHEELLDVRLCDLDLRLEGSAVGERVAQLQDELDRAGLRFRPRTWLSSDWFSPDGVDGFAIPFYLAHPRLMRIEHLRMLEVEGGSRSWCMKLLRHETGHAIDNAYRLHFRKRWRETFGKASIPYRWSYRPRPNSRSYVMNLDHWYAQSHPIEDWAECFAVWLQPGSQWRRRYAGWPALRKLEYVDELMSEIAGQRPRVTSRRTPDSLPQLRTTLRAHYERRQAWYGHHLPGANDEHLRRVFSGDRRDSRRATAAGFLRKHRHALRNQVAEVTGQYRYVVDQALREMIASCKKLGLRLARGQAETLVDAAILLTTLTMRFLHGGRQEFQR